MPNIVQTYYDWTWDKETQVGSWCGQDPESCLVNLCRSCADRAGGDVGLAQDAEPGALCNECESYSSTHWITAYVEALGETVKEQIDTGMSKGDWEALSEIEREQIVIDWAESRVNMQVWYEEEEEEDGS